MMNQDTDILGLILDVNINIRVKEHNHREWWGEDCETLVYKPKKQTNHNF